MRAFLTEDQEAEAERIGWESGAEVKRFVRAAFRLRNAMSPKSLDRLGEAKEEFIEATDKLSI